MSYCQYGATIRVETRSHEAHINRLPNDDCKSQCTPAKMNSAKPAEATRYTAPLSVLDPLPPKSHYIPAPFPVLLNQPLQVLPSKCLTCPAPRLISSLVSNAHLGVSDQFHCSSLIWCKSSYFTNDAIDYSRSLRQLSLSATWLLSWDSSSGSMTSVDTPDQS